MSLETYFTSLIEKVETSADIQNNGKDRGGFFEPTRAVLLQKLHLLRDLHGKPAAKAMVKNAWTYVVEHAPPEWLVLESQDRTELERLIK